MFKIIEQSNTRIMRVYSGIKCANLLDISRKDSGNNKHSNSNENIKNDNKMVVLPIVLRFITLRERKIEYYKVISYESCNKMSGKLR